MEEMHLVDSLLLISGQLQDVHGYTQKNTSSMQWYVLIRLLYFNDFRDIINSLTSVELQSGQCVVCFS